MHKPETHLHLTVGDRVIIIDGVVNALLGSTATVERFRKDPLNNGMFKSDPPATLAVVRLGSPHYGCETVALRPEHLQTEAGENAPRAEGEEGYCPNCLRQHDYTGYDKELNCCVECALLSEDDRLFVREQAYY